MKKIAFVILTAALAISALAQDFRSLALSLPRNVLVSSGVDGGVFMMSHSYQLKDTVSAQLFGRYGNTEFGGTFGPAIKVQGGYVVHESVIEPWKYDENYTRYRDNYVPVTYKVGCREFAENGQTVAIEGQIPEHQMLGASKYCIVKDSSLFEGKGFTVDVATGKKEGWCVWYTTPTVVESIDSLGKVTVLTTMKELTVSADQSRYEVEVPHTDANILGGIFVVPKQTAIGELSFLLAGIMVKGEEGWVIETPFLAFNPGDELSPVEEITPSDSETEVVEAGGQGEEQRPEPRRRYRRNNR